MYRANYRLVYIIDTVDVAYYNDLTVTLPVATLVSYNILQHQLHGLIIYLANPSPGSFI